MSAAALPRFIRCLFAAAAIYQCRHRKLSRPFTAGGETYRACLNCGARRRFDPAAWKMSGPFYYPGAEAPHAGR